MLLTRPKELWKLVKDTVGAWSKDYAPSMGAALSYYTLFSIAPLLLIVIAVAGLVFGAEAARGEIFGQLRGLMGDAGAKGVADLVQNASKREGEGILATVVGLLALALGATTVFGELQNDLDRIWRAPAREKAKGWWKLLRSRVLSFGMILGIAFLLMVSLVVSAALSALGKWWGPGLEAWPYLAQALDFVLSFGLMTLLFAMIYKIIPRVDIEWRDVWIGSAVTAALFALGKFLIGLYLGRSTVASAYGAAGSLVVMMLWVYYSAQIFLLGAEFTWVWAHRYGSRRHLSSAPATARKEGSRPEPTPPRPPVPHRPASASPRTGSLLELGLTAAAFLAVDSLLRGKKR